MKFLLVAVNAKYIHSNPAIYSLRAYAGESLRQYVELAEYTINQAFGEILADIYCRKPDVIGFSCYIWNWRLVQELLGEIPKLMPQVKLWLGGPEISYDADVIMRKMPWLAGIMVGEGEGTFRELLEYYVKCERSKKDFFEIQSADIGESACKGSFGGKVCTESSCKGSSGRKAFLESQGSDEGDKKDSLKMRKDNEEKESCPDFSGEDSSSERQMNVPYEEGLQMIPGLCLPSGYTPSRAPMDMNSVPFLYDDLIGFENKILYYESSRGCPFRCSYCLSSIERQVRVRDISVVKQELQFFLDHRVKQVKFVDRTFNCDHDHAMAVWSYLQEHDNGVTNFHFEISADILQENEIALLGQLRPGLVQLEIGVQSTNPKTLEAIRRRSDPERLAKTVAAIHKGRNIHQHLDLIAGLPYEDYGSFAKSFDQVYRMKPDQLQLGFLKVLKGSEMWERAEEYGIRYLEQPPYEVLYTRWLSYEEVLKLKRIEEMVELYYNSMQFTHTIPFLERAFAGPFAMYEALALFYEERGYFAASPARAYRYKVLLDFAVERDPARETVYKELLTYDMYLRENLKSRPEFAPERPGVREAVKEFYKREERQRRFLPEYAEYDWRQLSKMTHLEPFVYPVWDVQRMLEGYEFWGGAGSEEASSEAGFIGEDSAEKCFAERHSDGKRSDGEYSGGRYSDAEHSAGEYSDKCFINFALFDYRKRDPLTYEASVQWITGNDCGQGDLA